MHRLGKRCKMVSSWSRSPTPTCTSCPTWATSRRTPILRDHHWKEVMIMETQWPLVIFTLFRR